MSSTSDRIARLSPEKLAMLKRALGKASDSADPIAIVGMGCRFPQARGVDPFLQIIREGRVVTGEIPSSRWNLDAFYDPKGGLGKMTTRWGGFVDHIDRFDATFFGISPREAERMDPQQRLLLEVVWEAMEYGAMVPADYQGTRTGVFVGVGGVDYSRVPVGQEDYFEKITAYSGTGNALSIVANRISYILDLRGPSLSVDTACSSSLVAAHMAIRSLRSGECDAAIVGGVNAILTPETTMAFSQAQMLSPVGQCRPFDAGAAGYVRGEGCGAVILKRLSDAEAAGDLILATIRGSAVNQDGRTSGIAAPNGPAQEAVIHEALKDAGLTPDDVTYIEAHGTGTPLGDPIEVEALRHVFRRKSPDLADCYFGSVKANIGHTETVAGMASLIKLVLLLQHGFVPKQAHFEKLNPHIRLDGSRLRIAEQEIEWQPDSGSRIAGVSSFGFGGTNAHLVLEQAPQPKSIRSTEPPPPPAKQLYLVSAKTESDLHRMVARHAPFVRDHGDSFAAACYNSAANRSHFGHRLAVAATDANEAAAALQAIADGKRVRTVKQGTAKGGKRLRVGFLFTGQGSQQVGMGRELYDLHPVFRDSLERCDEILSDLLPERLLNVLWDDSTEASKLHQTQFTQPALFALEYSLAQLWQSIGIEPAVVLGHSVGEFAAACIAGVFSLEDGLRLIAHRARLMQSLPHDGSMAVVFAKLDRVREAISRFGDAVAIGVHNGPENVVISGRTEAVAELVAAFDADGIRTQPLNVSHAFHSPLMDPILEEFEQHAAQVNYEPPRIPLIANRTGLPIGDAICRPEYWRDHLRQTVLFADSVAALADQQIDVALELGPGTTLLGMARRAWSGESIGWIPSLKSESSDWDVLTDSVAELYVRGAKLNWSELYRAWPQPRMVLPVYDFEGQTYWYDLAEGETGSSAMRVATTGVSHPLLGRRLVMAGDKITFEASIATNSPAYLTDHRVEQSIVVPAAAYMAQALAAADEVFGGSDNRVVDLSIQQAMVLNDNQRRSVQLIAGPESKNECPFEIYSRLSSGGDDWTLHATGILKSVSRSSADSHNKESAASLQTLRDRLPHHTDGAQFYERMADCGLRYGTSFQVVKEIWAGDNEALAQFQIPESIRRDLNAYHVHPSLLDACLQTVAGVISGADSEANDLYLPVGVKDIRVHGPLGDEELFAHATLAGGVSEMGSVETNITLFQASGRAVAELIGARVQRVSGKKGSKIEDGTDWLYQIDWQAEALGDQPPSGDGLHTATQWILLGDSCDRFEQVRDMLYRLGDPVTVVKQRPSEEQIDQAFYERVLQKSLEQDERPNLQIVDLWGATTPDGGAPKADSQTQHTESPDRVAARLSRYATGLLQAIGKVKHWNSVRVNFITSHAVAIDPDETVSPAQTALWGLVRSAAMEMPTTKIRLIDCDLDTDDAQAELNGDSLLAELSSDSSENQIAFRGSTRYVARLDRTPDALRHQSESGRMRIPSDRFSLRLTTPGSFDALRYVSVPRRALNEGEVEVQVHSTGLNFSDVLKALGLYPGIKDEIVPLGIECAGVVTAVGPGVERVHVGQRVMGVAPYSFASHVVTPEYTLVATPDAISDDEAATIPITFLTAYHALCHLARLQPGERVLIHAGAGGVGLAAIQIAHAIGAEVFATAGSHEKRDFLSSLGVQHVMNSRSVEFADEVMRITDGQGVDVVLNSLPGEAITKSLSILAAYGRFLEIGKTDIYQNRPIGLWPFQDNLSYFAIDLDRMLRQRPNEIRKLYDDMMPHFESGEYQPLRLKSFPADQVADAFRYMAQRKNIGKVVVSMVDRSSHEQDESETQRGIHPHATYLITGGLGALGLHLAEWLAGQGASHLALLSRRAPNPETAERLDALRQSGVSVAVLQGDVADRDSLQAALASLPNEFPQWKGVIHAAGVLEDGLLSDMRDDALDCVLAPKVAGTWNLHQCLPESLDFFVLFSSAAATMGSPGQTNYSAGNAFMDGMARYRRQHGLPGASIAWGPWDDAGMAADENVRRQLTSRGMHPMKPHIALDLLRQAISGQASHVTVMDIDWNTLLSKLPGTSSGYFTRLRSSDSAGVGRDEAFVQAFDAATSEQRAGVVLDFVAAEVANVTGVDPSELESDRPLASLGLDSLMGMELKANLESKMGVEIPPESLFESPTIASLARVVLNQLSDSSVEDTALVDSSGSDHTKTEANYVVNIGKRRDGSSGSIFCLHPIGGDLRCYRQLARHLTDRTLYGLRAGGLDADSRSHETLDEMMHDYIASIRAIQPDGPYHLMGWSTGGIFAYEMARRMVADGEAVDALILLDAPQPTVFENVDLDDNARFLTDLVDFANYFAGSSMLVGYDELRELSEDEALARILRLSKEQRVLSPDANVEYLRRLVNVCKQHARVFQSYQPKPIQMTAHLIRPEDDTMLTEATGQTHDADFGWSRLVNLQMHQVPGHHFTMMTGEGAKALANKVAELLMECPTHVTR